VTGDQDPLAGDLRAFRTADADGLPVSCGVDCDGNVWLIVHGHAARLDVTTAMRLGGRLNGAGQRAVGAPRPPGRF
jgi:hypothetical protein